MTKKNGLDGRTRSRAFLRFGIYSCKEKSRTHEGGCEGKYNRTFDILRYFRNRIGSHKDWDIPQKKFAAIMRDTNSEILDLIIKNPGVSVILPCNMGELTVRTKVRKLFKRDGTLNRSLPIDRQATFDLWNNNPEAKEKKQVVHILDPNQHLFVWNSKKCIVRNRGHYHFIMTCEATKRLYRHIVSMNRDIIYPIYGRHSEENRMFNKKAGQLL